MNFGWDNIKNMLEEERAELQVGIELAVWKISNDVVIKSVMMNRGGRGILFVFICSFYMSQTEMKVRTSAQSFNSGKRVFSFLDFSVTYSVPL